MSKSGLRHDLKEEITYKEFEKQFGHMYQFSNKKMKADLMKGDYQKAIAKFSK